MINDIIIEGEKIILRKIDIYDVNREYINWLNDYEVVKYTESRFSKHTIETVEKYIASINDGNNEMFAIVEKERKKHIGNIKIGNINWIHRYADIGLIIGDKKYWGMGIAKEAIKLATEYAFDTLNLHRITAGIYALNVGSIKAFINCGFTEAYVEKNKYLFEGKYIDSIVVEQVNPNSEL